MTYNELCAKIFNINFKGVYEKMKLQYLGTAAAEGIPALFCECENCKRSRELGGRNIRSRSQALVDDKILIDFPADTFMHFIQHNVPLHKIKSCIITHSHCDHLDTGDLEMRIPGFSHLSHDFPLTFYSDKSGHDEIQSEIGKHNIKETVIKNVLIEPYKPFEAEGYTITALRASHDPKSTPVVYLIEKDGKSLFYSNDTSEYISQTWDYLKKLKKPIDLISLDCTECCNNSTYVGHMDLNRCIKLREELKRENIANDNTIFILNHFSHNGKNSVYDDFIKIASEYDFLVSYDGMILEF